MRQLSQKYALEGPDGTRVVFGNSDEARADPDWIALVDPDQGIVGLDGADHRESADVKVEEDGGIHGAFYRGRRPVIFNLVLDPHVLANDAAALERRLKRASRALREDSILRWAPEHIGRELELRLRRNAKVTSTGRRPWRVQVPMVSSDHRILSSLEEIQEIAPGAAAGIVGYSSPYSSPYGTELGASGQAFVVNEGDEETTARFRIRGPITNPEILHNDTGKKIALLYTLGAGEILEIDVARRSVELVAPLVLGDIANEAFNPNAEGAATPPATVDGWTVRAENSDDFQQVELAGEPAFRLRRDTDGAGPQSIYMDIAGDPAVTTGKWIAMAVEMRKDPASNSHTGTLSSHGNVTSTIATISTPLTDDWKRLELVAEITGADTSASLRGTVAGAEEGATYYTRRWIYAIRDSQAEAAAAIADYVDGDTEGYTWEGTPHGSKTRRVLEFDRANRYGAVLFPTTKWWRLLPGSNDVRLLSAAHSAGALLSVHWRHAYE